MKKMLTTLSAIAMLLSSVCAMSVSAEDTSNPYLDISSRKQEVGGFNYSLSISPFGKCYYRSLNWERHYDFLIVTTAEGLPEDLSENDTIERIEEWTGVSQLNGAYIYLMDTEEIAERYGDDIRIYHAYLKTNRNDIFVVNNECRRLMMEYDSILGTRLVEMRKEGLGVWDGTFQIEYTDAVDATLGTNPEEQLTADSYAEYQKYKDLYKTWKPGYDAWKAETANSQMTEREEAQSMVDAGLVSTYSLTSGALEAAKQICTDNPELVGAAVPGIEFLDETDVYSLIYAWNTFGDIDEDGEVTTSDAAEVLMAAAAAGAGGHSGLTEELEYFADVNSDGSFTAEDAAILQMYAAEQGSGSRQTLKEFAAQFKS